MSNSAAQEKMYRLVVGEARYLLKTFSEGHLTLREFFDLWVPHIMIQLDETMSIADTSPKWVLHIDLLWCEWTSGHREDAYMAGFLDAAWLALSDWNPFMDESGE